MSLDTLNLVREDIAMWQLRATNTMNALGKLSAQIERLQQQHNEASAKLLECRGSVVALKKIEDTIVEHYGKDNGKPHLPEDDPAENQAAVPAGRGAAAPGVAQF